MVNAWSLAASVLDGTLDEDYPIMKKDEIKIDTSKDQGVVNVPLGDFNLDQDITIKTDIEHSDSWYDYTRNDPDRENPFTDPKDRERAFKVTGNSEPDPFTDAFDYSMAGAGVGNTASYEYGYPSAFTTFSDNDDSIAHHVGLNYDELTLNIEDPIRPQEIMTDSRNKYHEKEILEDVEEYVSRTYNGHYTGTKHEYRNVQTIDLMASRDLASDFCQANILKYGSRYGSKDGRNKKDLLKVIHYAMLLLHFDEHYGKPSMTSGNIDFNMP
tara:strand:- start:1163 stop:1972 length:810 start_codon:yes stop_codon:yes gene_type:complete